MRRSFTIIALFIATFLSTLSVEIATPVLVMAGEPEPFELPQWTPFEMTVKPGTCMAQYDGMVSAPVAAPEHWWQAMGTPAFVEEMCSQYTRNKGWEVPQECGYQRYVDCRDGSPCGDDSADGRYSCQHRLERGFCWYTDSVLKRDYYCYCMRDAIVECLGAHGTDQTPARSKPKSSLASAFDKAIELVEAVGRAISYARSHPDTLSHVRLDGPLRSETHYRTSSSDADALYAKGMRAYEKTSHTDEETLEALTSFSACIEEDPTHVPCLWELGWVLYVNGHYGQTKILWDRVQQIDPNHADVEEQLRLLRSKL